MLRVGVLLAFTALALFTACAPGNVASPDKPRPELASSYYNRGVAHSRMDELDQAIADYSEALKLDPNYHSAYAGRGVIQRSHGTIEDDARQASRLGCVADS